MTSKPSSVPARGRALLPMVGLSLLLCAEAAAGTPDWLRGLAGQALPQYPESTSAVLLLDEQSTTVSGEGEIKTLYRRAYKIVRPEGRKYGTVVVYFDQETRLTYLKAWSISGGTEYEVKEKDAVETSPFTEALYVDTRLKVLTIPAAGPGSLIGYEYEQRRRSSVLQDRWRFQDEVPVRHARFILRLPGDWGHQDRYLNYRGIEPQSTGPHQWTWDLWDVPPVKEEPHMPSWRGLAGQMAVSFFPTRPAPNGNALRSWQDVGSWYKRLASASRESTPQIREKAAQLTAGQTAQVDKLRTLAAFVQREVRYVAIEIGIGGYQPHPAASVLANRYGDCKDKATLLAVMLRETGIDSFYFLLNSERGVVSPEFASMLNFDHVILGIRLPQDARDADFPAVRVHPNLGRLVFFDPTDEITPIGHLPAHEHGSRGLLVSPQGGELLELPRPEPGFNRLQRSARLMLDANGNLSGEVQEVRSGFIATEYRALLLKATPREQEKMLESFLGTLLNGLQVHHVVVEHLAETSKDLVLRYSFNAGQYGRRAGGVAFFASPDHGREEYRLAGTGAEDPTVRISRGQRANR